MGTLPGAQHPPLEGTDGQGITCTGRALSCKLSSDPPTLPPCPVPWSPGLCPEPQLHSRKSGCCSHSHLGCGAREQAEQPRAFWTLVLQVPHGTFGVPPSSGVLEDVVTPPSKAAGVCIHTSRARRWSLGCLNPGHEQGPLPTHRSHTHSDLAPISLPGSLHLVAFPPWKP